MMMDDKDLLVMLGDTLSRAKSDIQFVMDSYPVDVDGREWLEEASSLCGRAEGELNCEAGL